MKPPGPGNEQLGNRAGEKPDDDDPQPMHRRPPVFSLEQAIKRRLSGALRGRSRHRLFGEPRDRGIIGFARAEKRHAIDPITSRGTAISGSPPCAASISRSRSRSLRLGDQHQPLAAARIRQGDDGVALSGHAASAIRSAAASDTISPPSLAKRLARPTIVTNPSSSMRDDVAGIVPAISGGCSISAARPQIARHHVRAAQQQPAALASIPANRLQPVLDQRQKPADRAGAEMHRRVDRDDRRAFGDAIAFEDALAEPLGPDSAGLLAHRLGAGEDIAQRIEIIRVGAARIAGEKGVGAEQDRRADRRRRSPGTIR